jgi:hypothetical protein
LLPFITPIEFDRKPDWGLVTLGDEATVAVSHGEGRRFGLAREFRERMARQLGYEVVVAPAERPHTDR